VKCEGLLLLVGPKHRQDPLGGELHGVHDPHGLHDAQRALARCRFEE
jgi:hypothetical protein